MVDKLITNIKLTWSHLRFVVRVAFNSYRVIIVPNRASFVVKSKDPSTLSEEEVEIIYDILIDMRSQLAKVIKTYAQEKNSPKEQ